MRKNKKPLERFKIILPGVPASTSRGWLGYCTVVLFQIKGQWALFDTGHYSDREQLSVALNALGIAVTDIRHVVLSHLHFDHSLNLPLFPQAIVYLSRAELEHAQNVTSGKVQDPAIPECWPWLINNRELKIVDSSLEIDSELTLVTMPGHTPGCMALIAKGDETVAICGDILKNAWEAVTGQATSTAMDDSKASKSIGWILENADLIIPGHDRAFSMREKKVKYLTAITWQVKGHFFPRPRNEAVLTMDLPEGTYKRTD